MGAHNARGLSICSELVPTEYELFCTFRPLSEIWARLSEGLGRFLYVFIVKLVSLSFIVCQTSSYLADTAFSDNVANAV